MSVIEGEIETSRLLLQAITVDDAELMLAIWNDPDFIEQVADRGVRTIEQARIAIQEGAEQLFKNYGYGPYGMRLKSNHSQIGICGLFKRDFLDCPDLGFTILPDYRKGGYTIEAATAVIAHARDVLQTSTLAAITAPTNKPSRALIEKLGMNLESTFMMPGEEDNAEICLYKMQLGSA